MDFFLVHPMYRGVCLFYNAVLPAQGSSEQLGICRLEAALGECTLFQKLLKKRERLEKQKYRVQDSRKRSAKKKKNQSLIIDYNVSPQIRWLEKLHVSFILDEILLL